MQQCWQRYVRRLEIGSVPSTAGLGCFALEILCKFWPLAFADWMAKAADSVDSLAQCKKLRAATYATTLWPLSPGELNPQILFQFVGTPQTPESRNGLSNEGSICTLREAEGRSIYSVSLAFCFLGFRVCRRVAHKRKYLALVSCDTVISSASSFDDWPLEPDCGWLFLLTLPPHAV